jgi:hypothetical protein
MLEEENIIKAKLAKLNKHKKPKKKKGEPEDPPEEELKIIEPNKDVEQEQFDHEKFVSQMISKEP